MTPDISIICPCYNESEVVENFIREVVGTLNTIDRLYEIIFINDGSEDNTLDKLLSEKANNKNIRIIDLSSNFGKEAALVTSRDSRSRHACLP